MNFKAGEAEYRQSAIARLGDANLLIRAGAMSGAVYLAGRAVECVFRALIWKFDAEVRTGRKSLDTGHNLRQLLDSIGALGVFSDERQRFEIQRQLALVGRLWFNNMRFVSDTKLKTLW